MQLPKYRTYNTIIFDVRNNGGGNSRFGREILNALFGPDYVHQHIKKIDQNVYCDWRVSKDNIAFLATLISKVKNQFDPESTAVQSLTTLYDNMQQALLKGDKLVREWAEQPDNSTTSKNPEKLCSAKIIVLINHGCGSACLNFIDDIKAMEHPVTLVGKTTGADSLYMDVRTVKLPSSYGTLTFPQKVWRNRPRRNNQPHKPDIEYAGNINDTQAIEQWINEKVIGQLTQ